jgi:ribonuclease D
MAEFIKRGETGFRLITNNEAALAALETVEREEIIGLDTETYWSGTLARSRVSLVQIATKDDDVIVLDAQKVDLSIIKGVVESPVVMMAAHNARFDEAMLQGEGLKPAGFVDTLRLARLALRLPSYSLASVSEHLLGIRLDKSFQRSNWKRRPLTDAQLEYAAQDARVTLLVFERLKEILVAENRFDVAMRSAVLRERAKGEGRRASKRSPPVPLRELSPEERTLLLSLKKWRLERAFSKRLPAYMICPDRTLEQLVIEKPQTLEGLEAIEGIGPARIADYGLELLDLLRGK